jgi:hypothetical protein
MIALDTSPMAGRIANALVVYLQYLGKMFWPANLAIFYPFRDGFPSGRSWGPRRFWPASPALRSDSGAAIPTC